MNTRKLLLREMYKRLEFKIVFLSIAVRRLLSWLIFIVLDA